jgi:hypothetical protein
VRVCLDRVVPCAVMPKRGLRMRGFAVWVWARVCVQCACWWQCASGCGGDCLDHLCQQLLELAQTVVDFQVLVLVQTHVREQRQFRDGVLHGLQARSEPASHNLRPRPVPRIVLVDALHGHVGRQQRVLVLAAELPRNCRTMGVGGVTAFAGRNLGLGKRGES